ncbi:hypothetical protein J2T56_002934 [Natronobacillus azotifigens]|uniref:Phosphoenolpyruvate synthase n=1 Tax=Natronobacillus azotifigens TaxID=472978 RepID=A0A9J6RA16_9BACI|nr:pyruvate kinase [Natronobacillus azotifigens]
MSAGLKISTGIHGFDQTIDGLRLGDNVVWQVDDIKSYQEVVDPFVKQSLQDERKVIYIRFGNHEPLLSKDVGSITIYHVNAENGFESFATEIHRLIEKEGKKAFYVFDRLTDLLSSWCSDLMIGNFFRVCCPYLYELDTIAYFALTRNVHTYSTIARIRETTQVLLDLYQVKDDNYIHPLKVWERYSPTMFFPHLITGDEVKSITASSEAANLFANINRMEERPDYWDSLFAQAREDLTKDKTVQENTKKKLIKLLLGEQSRMIDLCEQYFDLEDILQIASREVGTGFIGGKSVGMLLARKILAKDPDDRFRRYIEAHDSFFIGSDIFYTYIVQNGWWKQRVKQKTKAGYYHYAEDLREKLLAGSFPANVREQFMQMLEYFGQSPIIVRSSSLLEDNFGNAFAGKYESVFCVNQGTPEERYQAFVQAIRQVYASTMNKEALDYRMNRGLFEKDEQMAILVQRVSGDHYGEYFFPHTAGVGNSSNLYVWDQSVDMNAGMLRLVFGLGTRAVDRTVDDYARIVTLDDPSREQLMYAEDQKKFAQQGVDVLSIKENELLSIKLDQAIQEIDDLDKQLFASVDLEADRRLKELGYHGIPTPHVLNFKQLLKQSHFPKIMKEALATISKVYDYPVDIEFTANFKNKDDFQVNLVQCRPLQTRGLGQSVTIEKIASNEPCYLQTEGNFMGGNVRLPLDYIISIDIEKYAACSEQEKYTVARQVGTITRALKKEQVMLVGPGRWGTSTPSLGVPVHFSEIQHVDVICEVASVSKGFVPELSYGSHFFQDIVESNIFYVAIFEGNKDVRYHPEYLSGYDNEIETWIKNHKALDEIIHVAKVDTIELQADIIEQKLLCR